MGFTLRPEGEARSTTSHYLEVNVTNLTVQTIEDLDAIESFLSRYTGGTLKTYRVGMKRLAGWADENGVRVLELKRAHIDRYMRYLQEDMGLKGSTALSYFGMIRIFFRLLVADDEIERDPTLHVKRPRAIYDETAILGLDREQMARLIRHAVEKEPMRGALVMLMGVLGLRVSEACSVNVEDCYDTEREHRVLRIMGKGERPATIPLPDMVADQLVLACGDRTEGPLITTRTGRRADRNTAYKWLATMSRDAGMPEGMHPHTLRHSAVTAALDAGVPLRDAQVFARHSDVRLTQRYDRNRLALERHGSYKVAEFLSAPINTNNTNGSL